jgi:hypothetical protein
MRVRDMEMWRHVGQEAVASECPEGGDDQVLDQQVAAHCFRKENEDGVGWLSLFGPGIKRNVVRPEETQLLKHGYDVTYIDACLENSAIIVLSGSYRGCCEQ